MHDMYTHTEGCTQTFKEHLRSHLATRKQSLGSGNVFVATTTPTTTSPGIGGGPVIPNPSNMSSAETLKPINAPTCTCGLPVKDESERLWSGAGGGPFCECKQRVTVMDDGSDGDGHGDGAVRTQAAAGAGVEAKDGKASRFKRKALDILCSACTGYVARPKAGGFYTDAQ